MLVFRSFNDISKPYLNTFDKRKILLFTRSMSRYNASEVELKWQQTWYKDNLYKSVDNDQTREKRYILVEFPYPSGEKLHMGHTLRYTYPDIYSRYLRMKGYNVLFPIAYDSFGLPTEERARKDGKNPAVTTKENIEAFREQVKSLGYSFDWEREFSTTDPDYYKWTQWIFGEMFKKGLVEQRQIDLWWCPNMGTVLANEEVVDGPDGVKISERGEHPVERKSMKQWVIKITEFADTLVDGLNDVAWPEYIKDMQRNWIGKSVGAEVDWEIVDVDGILLSITATTFTTRKDTIPGVSYIVYAPEHKDVLKLVIKEQLREIEEYQLAVKNKSDRDRQISKEKTGVFTGSYAKNPFNGQLVPVWISDYVMANYGTGVVMGMGGHDERDREFSLKFNLPVVFTTQVPEGFEDVASLTKIWGGEGKQVNTGVGFDGLKNIEASEKIMEMLEIKGVAKRKINYKLRDWVFSRQRYWGEPFPFEYIKSDLLTPEQLKGRLHTEVDGEDYIVTLLPQESLPLVLPEVEDYEPSKDGRSPLSKTDWIHIRDNTSAIIGKHESDTMPNWAGSSWYYLRYTDPKNTTAFASQVNLKYWLPVDHYFGGSEHTTLHLLYSRMWHQFLYQQELLPQGKNSQGKSYAEPYYMRTNGGMLLAEDGTKMSKSKGNVINPADKIEQYGADALRLAIAFIAPYEQTVAWVEGGIKATRKFLEDIVKLNEKVIDGFEDSEEVVRAVHLLIKRTEEGFASLKSNVAVAEMMTVRNVLSNATQISVELWKMVLKVIAPFAPHLMEELWSNNGYGGTTIHTQSWPQFDPTKVLLSTIPIAVQVNGKIRAELMVPAGIDDTELLSLAKESVAKWLDSKTLKFSKVIPGKMVTLAVSE
jgi:leucyl-tRNA synthetase